jgi:hypothetical protein
MHARKWVSPGNITLSEISQKQVENPETESTLVSAWWWGCGGMVNHC